MLDQISVFVENKKGRLAAIMKLINDNGIDIRALTIADTTDFGIVRMIVSSAEEALKIFRENNCIASVAKVTAFTINDRAGAMYEVVRLLEEQDINIEYCYSLMGKKENMADIVIKTNQTEKAEQILTANGIALISTADIL